MKDKNNIEDITPEFASEILRRLTFHFIRPKESKKRSIEDTNVILAALNKSMMLIEKQIPKRVIENDLCPVCKAYLNSDPEDSYCFNCGQAVYFGGIKDECN